MTDAVDGGTAGASARREHRRRVVKREAAVRARHPRLGGLILALSDDPQSTTAWQRGAVGEERLGATLDGLTPRGVRVLHDRRIPGRRANLDHIVVGPSGVYVTDAKRYRGRPAKRVDGGLLRPRTASLVVGGRRCDGLVRSMHTQVDVVRRQLGPGVPVTGLLVFVDADWPLVGGDFVIDGVHVLWPQRAADLVTRPGPASAEVVDAMHRHLASVLPPA